MQTNLPAESIESLFGTILTHRSQHTGQQARYAIRFPAPPPDISAAIASKAHTHGLYYGSVNGTPYHILGYSLGNTLTSFKDAPAEILTAIRS